MEGIMFGEGETREIGVMFDWTNDDIVKDWSLTAWGENSKPTVRHSNYPNEKTQHMPQHTDDKTNVTPPEPIPEPDDDGTDGNDR